MFTESEYSMLLKSLDALEHMNREGSLMGDLLGSITCRTEEERRKLTEDRKAEALRKEGERRQYQEEVILLKAKLVSLQRNTSGKDLVVTERKTYESMLGN